ncbi:hypothetical protein LAZ67_11003233 [Cordylochernes scorpioides]|uniref:Uncharacterized protein n=1 Tax=Cordylochernes scorpioides TaxID=51811 RepID=A0ABY6L080_9ARAC|nr:hypothetical protein LAZ67_11003233 [Cordylochernes scorpioides]
MPDSGQQKQVDHLVIAKVYHHPNTGKLTPYTILEIISPNVVKINRPNQPLNKEHDTIHVNKLRPYTESVPHIAPPTMQAHYVQPKDNDLFTFRHLSPDLFQEYQFPIKPSSSQPLLPLIPNLYTLIQVEPTSSNNVSPVPQLQINHEPTQSQVRPPRRPRDHGCWTHFRRLAPGFHRRSKAKTSLEDHDVPIDATTTKPLFTPQEKGREGTRDKVPRLRWNPWQKHARSMTQTGGRIQEQKPMKSSPERRNSKVYQRDNLRGIGLGQIYPQIQQSIGFLKLFPERVLTVIPELSKINGQYVNRQDSIVN